MVSIDFSPYRFGVQFPPLFNEIGLLASGQTPILVRTGESGAFCNSSYRDSTCRLRKDGVMVNDIRFLKD